MNLLLKVSLLLVPFEKWIIYYIQEIYHSSSSCKKYIIVAIEYLTKQTETKVVTTNVAKIAANFLFKEIFTQFGCLKILISDRGQYFLNKVMEGVTKWFKINHQKTTSYYLQTNSHTKRVNQILMNILKKTVVDAKQDQDIKLSAILWAYRTTFKVTTQATPFSLVYGLESILPIELEILSLKIAINEKLSYNESLKEYLEW